LLETVADVAKDLRDEGAQTLRDTSSALVLGSLLIALLNLFIGRLPEPARPAPAESPAPGSGNGKTAARPHRMEKEYADPALRQN
jgi:hypothetical protein